MRNKRKYYCLRANLMADFMLYNLFHVGCPAGLEAAGLHRRSQNLPQK
jgi:hypothetical protein